MKNMKKLFSLLLCLVMLTSLLPASYAEDTVIPDAASETEDALPAEEPVNTDSAETQCDEPAELPADPEPTEEDLSPAQPQEDTAAVEPTAEEDEPDGVSEWQYGEFFIGASNGELMTQYVRTLFGLAAPPSLGAAAPELVLGEADYHVERQLKAAVSEIADGTRSSTAISVTLTPYRMADLDMHAVFDALIKDATAELYWSERSYSWGWNRTELFVTFYVAADYQGADDTTVDSGKILAAREAAANARAIVAKYSGGGYSDVELLRAYKDEILALVDYNYDAAYSSGGIQANGSNPWELVYVFDGDPETKVVCEGYSKAFQYLCDQTSFRSPLVNCICADGDVYWSNGGGGGHMWNLVRMDDGRTYLIDVTACEGHWDSNHSFLLHAVSGSPLSYDGYTVSNGDRYTYYQVYSYYDGTQEYVESVSSAFTRPMLTISALPYGQPSSPCDLDGDGALSETDAALLVALLKTRGASASPAASADLNGDGVVNGADLVFLAKHLPK